MSDETEGKETTIEEISTPENELEVVRAELGDIKVKLEQTEKGLRTAHQTITKKEEDIRKQSQLNTRLDDLDERLRILVAMQGNESLGDLPDEEKRSLLGKYDQIEKEQAEKRKRTEAKAQQDEYNRKADAIYIRAKEVFKDDDDGLEKVENLLMLGRIDKAEEKISKAESTSKSTKEDADVKFNKRLEEEKRKWMEESGLLKTETGMPSGRGLSDEDFVLKIGSGELEMTPDNLKRAKSIRDKLQIGG